MRDKRDGRFAPMGVMPHVTLPMLKIIPSCDRLIFNMRIPIPGKTVFLLGRDPKFMKDWEGPNTCLLRLLRVSYFELFIICIPYFVYIFLLHCKYFAPGRKLASGLMLPVFTYGVK